MARADLPAGARDLAISAARDAGAILRDRLHRARTIDFKGTVDLVTDADRASEQLIASRIREAFPHHRLLGEEGARGAVADGHEAPEYGWVVDPLDGTTNYAHGYPHFAVSIALEQRGTVVLGVVYDPMRDELFVAERGSGATLNGEPLHVSTTDQLIRSLLATGFPYDIEQRAENSAIWDILLNASQGTRRDGSAALNLCYVAAGRFDGFWERPLQPWDLAAGGLIILEAGGTVTTYDEEPFDPYRREVIASNGHIHEAMVGVVHQALRPPPAPPAPSPRSVIDVGKVDCSRRDRRTRLVSTATRQGAPMDPATDEFHERFLGAVRTAEVMSVFFLRVGQSLILDMRRHGEEGPLLLLDDMVATPSDRLLSFRRLRPELPLPERLTLAPWPGAIRSLAETGILDAIVERCRLEGGEQLVDQIHELYRELKTIERTQLRDLVRGVGMKTLWQRGPGD